MKVLLKESGVPLGWFHCKVDLFLKPFVYFHVDLFTLPKVIQSDFVSFRVLGY